MPDNGSVPPDAFPVPGETKEEKARRKLRHYVALYYPEIYADIIPIVAALIAGPAPSEPPMHVPLFLSARRAFDLALDCLEKVQESCAYNPTAEGPEVIEKAEAEFKDARKKMLVAKRNAEKALTEAVQAEVGPTIYVRVEADEENGAFTIRLGAKGQRWEDFQTQEVMTTEQQTALDNAMLALGLDCLVSGPDAVWDPEEKRSLPGEYQGWAMTLINAAVESGQWSVGFEGAFGQFWTPDAEANAEINAHADPFARALWLCATAPKRGVWS